MPLVEFLEFEKKRISEFVVESAEFSRKMLQNRKLISDIYLRGHSITTWTRGGQKCLFLSTLRGIITVHAEGEGDKNGKIPST